MRDSKLDIRELSSDPSSDAGQASDNQSRQDNETNFLVISGGVESGLICSLPPKSMSTVLLRPASRKK